MRSRMFLFVLGVCALALSVAQTASAVLTGAVCEVGAAGTAGDGVAVIGPGFNSMTATGIPFEFTNSCGGGGPTVGCSIGHLDNNQCSFGAHNGDFIYCPVSGCSVGCGALGADPCDGTNVDTAQFFPGGADCIGGKFSGFCIGSLCVGSTTLDVAYVLAFSVDTVQEAGAKCGPTGTGADINSASFSGLIVY